MAGGHEDAAEAAKLSGLGKYFNSVTLRGRANVTIATYAFCGVLGMYFYLKPKKQAPAS